MLKHGIIAPDTPGDNPEFYWMGEQVSLAEFNDRVIMQMRAVQKGFDGIQIGMDLAEKINSGQKTVIQIDVLEEVLKLPLCEDCKRLIGQKGTAS